MLSEAARTLVEKLRLHRTGTPDVRELMELWEDNDPKTLRPAIEELEGRGFIEVHRGIPMNLDRRRIEYGLRDVVSVSVTELLQSYCDEEGL